MAEEIWNIACIAIILEYYRGEHSSMKISIVIPVYNVEKYLGECLDSLIRQTNKDFEVILVDDGSEDASGKICDEYVKLYPYITTIHNEHGGVTNARRCGLMHAKGEYIWFVDSDDRIDDNSCEILINLIKDYKVDIVGFSYERFNMDNVVVNHGMKLGKYNVKRDLEYICNNIFTSSMTGERGIIRSLCTMVIKKEIIEYAYETISDEVQYAEDAALPIASILLCENFYLTDIILYFVRVRDGSIMHGANPNYYKHINEFYNYFANFIKGHQYQNLLKISLDRYMDELVILGLNQAFHYDGRVRIPNYVCNLKKYQDPKKIILYGAAIVGQSYRIFLQRNTSHSVVKWVDRNWKKYVEKGLQVDEISVIENTEYDFILLAVQRKKLADKIRANLHECFNIDDEKIYWESPTHILDYYNSNI